MTEIKVEVSDIEQVAPLIRQFTLKAVDTELYPFSPGSHVVVSMQGEDKTYKNAYSLCSDPFNTNYYQIAVRLQEQSRGGSVFMHEKVKVGDQLVITPPSNFFLPDWRAKKHILIAGGVGVTPFMSYLYECERRQADIEFHYLFRSSQTGAYHEELEHILGERYFSYDADESQRASIETLFADQPIGSHFYVCGPQSLIDDVIAIAKQLGWPKSSIHYEVFAVPKPGKPFVAEVKSTGMKIEVDAETTLLEALEQAGVDIASLCRGGVCGQCYVGVASGELEHRDEYLSDDEKAAQNCVMPCVSRAVSDHIILEC